MDISLWLTCRSWRVILCESNFLGILRRIERESRVVEGRRKIPGKHRAVLRPRFVSQSCYDQLSRQWIIPVLNPNLPVETLLPIRILLAGRAFDLTRADIHGGFDLADA